MGRSLTFWSWCVLFLPQFFKNSLTCFWTQLTGIRIHLIIRMMDGWNQVFNDWSEEILNFFNSMCAPVHPQELKAEITVDENFNEYIRTTTTTGRCSSLATAVESRFALRRGSDLPPLNTTSCFIWCRSSQVQLQCHWTSWGMIIDGIGHIHHVELPFVLSPIHRFEIHPAATNS